MTPSRALQLPQALDGHWRVYRSTSSMGLQLVLARLGEAQCRSASKECTQVEFRSYPCSSGAGKSFRPSVQRTPGWSWEVLRRASAEVGKGPGFVAFSYRGACHAGDPAVSTATRSETNRSYGRGESVS